MKKLNYITVLGLAAGLTFAFNAAAQSDSTPETESVTGIYKNNSGAWMDENSSGHSTFLAIAEIEPSLTITDVSLDISGNGNFKKFLLGDSKYAFGYYVKTDDFTSDDFNLNTALQNPDSNVVQVGTFTYDSSGHEIKNIEGLNQSVSFSQDDLVGIWVATVSETGVYGTVLEDDFFLSTESGKSSTTSGPSFKENDGMAGVWLGYENDGKKGLMFTLSGNGYNVVQSAEPAGGASGTPLPGVWATIALAGAASAYLKRRRKENK